MVAFSKLLCVVDPTKESQPTIGRAARLAAQTGADLELLVCYYNEYLAATRLFDAAKLERVRTDILVSFEEWLERLAEPLRQQGITVRTSAIWDHPLHEGIVRHAIKIDAGIVFKDTHAHSAVSRAFLTHTDWELVRICPAPLWLVKPVSMPDKPVLLAAVDPMNTHDKPATLDTRILEVAKRVSEALDGQVHVFHAFDPRIGLSSATASAYLPVSLPLDEISKEMREQHGRRMTELAAAADIVASRTHLVSGLVHEELPELAGKLAASVVIMGAVARNRLERLFIGATAGRSLAHLPCDLLIVKPEVFESPLAADLG